MAAVAGLSGHLRSGGGVGRCSQPSGQTLLCCGGHGRALYGMGSVPHHRCAEVLTPSPCECDLTWEQSAGVTKQRWVVRVGP